jgi:cytochrome c
MKSILICALTAAAVLVSNSALANLELAKKNNCLACHAPDKKLVGPAYQDVAKRYAGKKGMEEILFQRVKKGATVKELNWKAVTGGVPMPPNTLVSDADLHTLLKWILAGAK